MFNRYIIQDCSRGISAASSAMAHQMRLDRESREKIAQQEIEARDRIDISRKEYEDMKQEIETLTSENRRCHDILERIGMPLDKISKIIPNSMNIMYFDSYIEFKRRARIEFDIEFDINER